MARRGDGLYLRSKTWYLDFRHDGQRHVVRLGKGISRSVAGEIASVKRGAILKGEAGIGKKRKDISLEKAAAAFLSWTEANKRPKTVYTYRQCLDQLKKGLPDKTLAALNPFLLEKYKKGRVDAGAPVRANRELACLKTLINRCVEWGLYEGSNPVEAVKFVKESRGRIRYLETEEETKLLTAAGEPLRSLIVLGINTGLRVQAEALRLRWADVDLRRGVLLVLAAYSKNGESRAVPLNSRSREVLEALKPRAKGEFVFAKASGMPYHSVRNVFDSACERAGLKDVTPHTLRHTFASRLAMDGVDLRTIQELGGWKKLAMVERYSHPSPRHKVEAIERIAKSFHNAIHNTPKGEIQQLAVSG